MFAPNAYAVFQHGCFTIVDKIVDLVPDIKRTYKEYFMEVTVLFLKIDFKKSIQ